MNKCPICKSKLIKRSKIQYISISPKLAYITGVKEVFFCPKHWEYEIEEVK